MQLANVDDPKVKKAVLANVITETVVSVVMACLVAYQLSDGDFGEAVGRKFKHWHDQLFGPPPPTEEEIKRQARLVHIEAARIVREAMP
jgi:thiamine biosynthesis lipoprotein ApbE